MRKKFFSFLGIITIGIIVFFLLLPQEPGMEEGEIITLSFAEFDRQVGPANIHDGSQKEEIWSWYEGRYFRWTGTVISLNEFYDSYYVGVRILPTTGKYDVGVNVRKEDFPIWKGLSVGDSIRVVGKMMRSGGGSLPYFLEDGRLELLKKSGVAVDTVRT